MNVARFPVNLQNSPFQGRLKIPPPARPPLLPTMTNAYARTPGEKAHGVGTTQQPQPHPAPFSLVVAFGFLRSFKISRAISLQISSATSKHNSNYSSGFLLLETYPKYGFDSSFTIQFLGFQA